jgi:short-subunit dehydrogenase
MGISAMDDGGLWQFGSVLPGPASAADLPILDSHSWGAAMDSLRDKLVVITGAGSGIGRALAHECARHRARLLLADVNGTALAQTAAALTSAGATCDTLVVDVADPQAIARLAAHALERHGGADVLVNNAGVGLAAPVASLAPADAHWLMDINFWGVVHGCRAFLPQLQARPQALVVNLSSIFAMISAPTASIYNASKAAVRAFSDALRCELHGTGVGVLCVHPGGVRTAIAEASRVGDVSMIASGPAEMRARFAAETRTTPEAAAQAIVAAMLSGRTRLLIGIDARIGDWVYRLFPARASLWVCALMRALRRRHHARARQG